MFSYSLSLTEALTKLREPAARGEVSTKEKYYEWDLGLDYPEALRRAERGDRQALEAVEDDARKLLPEVLRETEARKLQRFRAVAGAHPNIGAYLAGDPNCMFGYRLAGTAGLPSFSNTM